MLISLQQGLQYSQTLNRESVTSGFNAAVSRLVTSSFSLPRPPIESVCDNDSFPTSSPTEGKEKWQMTIKQLIRQLKNSQNICKDVRAHE